MIKIAIIIGSTRPGRIGESVGKWVYNLSKNRKDAEFELIDVADYNLPLYDEPLPAGMQQYSKNHTKIWSSKINEFDGYIFVTAEYNHSVPGALKNAIDFLAAEWNNKAAGFVSYGSAGGARAVEHLRQIAGELQMADVRAQVMLSLFTDFVNMSEFKPDPRHEEEISILLEQVISWSNALKTVRSK
ncbi:NADPH-dependent FMN reductase [Sedimentibacter sp. MB31-C6]|uniref:NADPH-dependent FMN reductase n=1 Tax=Sedimentibacter sp. MB31-C6 TaxID=3109366 RepID=UPI002DDD0AC0|nr:NAD(P)H-dependent oxidoreductase [Sedimentibacter sp. MB36-C1]WSI02978.1 NAD(P)H-dependent oxidoreductase [Sedimentibacter sp. MB36-C1]